jgi:hypothetical protein
MHTPDATRRGNAKPWPFNVIAPSLRNDGHGYCPERVRLGLTARFCDASPSTPGSRCPHLPQAGTDAGDDRRMVEACQRGRAETQ